MSENFLIDKDLARVIDILDQVKKLNERIEFHKEDSIQSLMASQYEDMKMRFLEELKDILITYKIDVQIQDKAA